MTPCRICAAQEATPLFTKDFLTVVRCKQCGLVYTDALPAATDLKEFYGESYFRSHGAGTSYADYLREERAMTVTARERLAAIRKVKSPPGALLDVGCATGFFLNAARQDWDVEGVELSEYASSYARTQYGLSVRTGTLREAAFPDDSFDVVTMWDVIEHLARPLQDLAEVRRILRTRGVAVFSTGDAGSLFARACGRHWHLYNPTQHLSFFTRETVKALLERAGFRVLRITKPSAYFTVSYLTSSLAMYYPNALTTSLDRAVEKTRLKDLALPVNLRDIMTVYAAKRF